MRAAIRCYVCRRLFTPAPLTDSSLCDPCYVHIFEDHGWKDEPSAVQP